MARPATVVHLRMKGGVEVVSCDVYIGRAMYQGGCRLPASKWANPYKVGDAEGSRALALREYEAYVRRMPELVGALPELRGMRLGCWCVGPRCLICHGPRGRCAHLSCHGEVLLRLLAEQDAAQERAMPIDELAAAAIRDDDPYWAELLGDDVPAPGR